MEKMMKCKACGKDIAKGVKKCPNCGKDQRKFFMRHKILSSILILAILFGVFYAMGSNTSTAVDTSVSINEYKDQCKNVSYDDIARDPDKYKGSKVIFIGEIIQIQENGSNVALRVNVNKDQYGIYKDTIWVNYTYSANEKKLLENDVISIWGESKGNVSYKSVLGSKITIPQINARTIDFMEKSNN